MTDDDLARWYYDTQYHDARRAFKVPSQHHRRLAQRVGIRSGQRLLDVACGTGSWLLAVTEHGAHGTGVDLSAYAIDMCRSRNADACFHVAFAERLPFDNSVFD